MTIAVLGLGSIGLRHAGNLLDLGERVVGTTVTRRVGRSWRIVVAT